MVQDSNGDLKTRLKKFCLLSKMSSIWMFCQVIWLYHLNTGHPSYCPVSRCLLFPKVYSFADEDVFRTLSGSTPIQRDAICGALSRRRSSVSRHERRSSVSGHERSKIVSIVSVAEEEDLESREGISMPRKSSVNSQGKQAWSKLGS